MYCGAHLSRDDACASFTNHSTILLCFILRCDGACADHDYHLWSIMIGSPDLTLTTPLAWLISSIWSCIVRNEYGRLSLSSEGSDNGGHIPELIQFSCDNCLLGCVFVETASQIWLLIFQRWVFSPSSLSLSLIDSCVFMENLGIWIILKSKNRYRPNG